MREMTTWLPFVILGIVEGLTEFIPVSSSGHLILARLFLTLPTGNDLAVDAVLQLATACALLVYFWRDILHLASTAFLSLTGSPTENKDWNMLVAILVGTIPAVVLGLLLEKQMETIFRSASLVAYTLIAGSALLVAAEWWMKRYGQIFTLEALTWQKGLIIGLFQSLALVPGMSRSGMTMAGGMFLGFSRADAARFGFLLSIPILFGSGLKKMYDLQALGAFSTIGAPLLIGALVAFVTGLLAIWFLMAIVRKTPLTVFALYRVALAVLILVLVA